MADDHLRPRRGGGDLVDIERRGVRRQDAVGLGDLVQLAENLLLQRHSFEHRFDDDVGLVETVVSQTAA